MFSFSLLLKAEDGSKLWLRYKTVEVSETPHFSGLSGDMSTIALKEFKEAWKEMTGNSIQRKPDWITILF